jgi:hypothetical protein
VGRQVMEVVNKFQLQNWIQSYGYDIYLDVFAVFIAGTESFSFPFLSFLPPSP